VKRFSEKIMPRQLALAMRRRFQRFLPIILIALVVQILAPIGAHGRRPSRPATP